MTRPLAIQPGPRAGAVEVPWSKSHLHRLLIADYLAGGRRHADLSNAPELSDDVRATCRCLASLARHDTPPVLDCGESGSTLRFLLPVAMAVGGQAVFTAAGRLPQRPLAPFLELLADHGVISLTGTDFPLRLEGRLSPGEYRFRGDISSQIVTGLLLALPILADDSRIRWTTPLESRGYVELTLQVMRQAGLHAVAVKDGFDVPGGQRYALSPELSPETDWSGASFWLAMNRLGSHIVLPPLNSLSAQPDAAIVRMLDALGGCLDVSGCPDIFPPLAAAAAAIGQTTRFIHTRRLRYKESDRIAAMAAMLDALGVRTDIDDDSFIVHGNTAPLHGGGAVKTFGDHRIAMAAAVAATAADAPVTLDDADCVAKSYPGFWEQFDRCR